jgi:ketosteroid isomerase-like protein
MELGKLRINQLSEDGWAWYQRYLTVLDAYDVDGYADFLADDVTVRFNNDEPLTGLAAARNCLQGFWGSITGMGCALVHEPLNIYGDDRHLVMEALNHYDRPGSPRVTVRATAWTDRGENGKVTAVRLYQDLSPLYTGG